MEPAPIKRLTVVERLYYQQPGLEPRQLDLGFTRLIGEDEQPYERQCRADNNWSDLDTGWIERPGMISIRNEEGRVYQTNPDDAEQQRVAQCVLEIGYDCQGIVVPILYVEHGESLRFSPASVTFLRIRSTGGPCKYLITVYPT